MLPTRFVQKPVLSLKNIKIYKKSENCLLFLSFPHLLATEAWPEPAATEAESCWIAAAISNIFFFYWTNFFLVGSFRLICVSAS